MKFATKCLRAPQAFRTDTEISQTGSGPRAQRELQAWQAPADGPAGAPHNGARDDATFGPGATGGSWDQFTANEQMFGVTASFDEDVYTTKLDRNAPDFKERERKAQQIANEIMGVSTLQFRSSPSRVPPSYSTLFRPQPATPISLRSVAKPMTVA